VDRRSALAGLAVALGDALVAPTAGARDEGRCYAAGARIDEDVFVLDAEQRAIPLVSLLRRRVNLLFIFGGAEGAGTPRLWCGDSQRELPMLDRLRERYRGKGVGVIPIAVPPVYSEKNHGYDEGGFLKAAESDPVYIAAVAGFVAQTEELQKKGGLGADPLYFDPRFRLLDNPRQGPHVPAYGPVFPWQGRFKACRDAQRHGTPALWLIGMDGTVLCPPFWGNVYEGDAKTVRYVFEDVARAIDAALAVWRAR
jgi:hypothetical protein